MTPLRPLDVDLTDVLEHSLRPGAGAWTVGVVGAIAEHVVDASTTVRDVKGGLEAVGPTGGVRLVPGPDAQLLGAMRDGQPDQPVVLVLATPRQRGRWPEVVTRLGPDEDAIRPEDRGADMVDLGLGLQAARFLVRSRDPAVLARLSALEGQPWSAATHADVEDLVARSPHRVLTSAVGRIEVYAPIPPRTGASPQGCHTHLLPAELELGHELSVGLRLAPGLVPGAVFHPGPAWPGLPS